MQLNEVKEKEKIQEEKIEEQKIQEEKIEEPKIEEEKIEEPKIEDEESNSINDYLYKNDNQSDDDNNKDEEDNTEDFNLKIDLFNTDSNKKKEKSEDEEEEECENDEEIDDQSYNIFNDPIFGSWYHNPFCTEEKKGDLDKLLKK